MKKSISISVLLLLLFSCIQNKDFSSCVETKKQKSEYFIPIEEALRNLYSFMGISETKRDNIKSIETIYSSKVITKGSPQEELLYVICFKDNSGSAVLAADNRIPDKVLAVSENGSFTTNRFKQWIQITEDQVFDPKTFQLYNEEYNDYYVGDYTTDSTYSSVSSAKASDFYIEDLIYKYADNFTKIDDHSPEKDNSGQYNTIIGGSTDENEPYDVETSTKVDSIKVTPLLSPFVNWRQRNGCNAFSPNGAPNGCVPLAIAKIMAYNKGPTIIEHNRHFVNWDNLLSFCDDKDLDKTSISALTRRIGEDCHSLYTRKWTFTLPSQAAGFLKNNRYSGVAYEKYSTNKVYQTLNNRHPIFICAIPQQGISTSHGWNIDGYKGAIITITQKKTYKTSGKVVESKGSKLSLLVHCDFGWGGESNGYYASGIFDLTKCQQLDSIRIATDSDNFNKYIKTITYESIK